MKKYFWAGLAIFLTSAGVWLVAVRLTAVESPVEFVRPMRPPYGLPRIFFDESFAALPEPVVSQDSKIFGVIVNHHLLGSRLIAETLNNVSFLKPQTVVLVSPNHFGVGSGPVLLSSYDWQTHYGLLEHDSALGSALVEQGLAKPDERPFADEHGVSGLTAHIKRVFPKARFVPIIFKDTADPGTIADLAGYLAEFDPNQLLVVASLDFSHDSTRVIAEARDQASIAAIQTLDPGRVNEVAVDSRPALELLVRYARLQGAKRFIVLNNTNSSSLANVPNQPDVTSYITGIYTD